MIVKSVATIVPRLLAQYGARCQPRPLRNEANKAHHTAFTCVLCDTNNRIEKEQPPGANAPGVPDRSLVRG